jgi:hypothetical protein
MKTALQQAFSDLEELHPNLFNVYTTEGKEFINHFHKYLAMEKEQIIKAASNNSAKEAYRAGQDSMYCGCYEIDGCTNYEEWIYKKQTNEKI